MIKYSTNRNKCFIKFFCKEKKISCFPEFEPYGLICFVFESGVSEGYFFFLLINSFTIKCV